VLELWLGELKRYNKEIMSVGDFVRRGFCPEGILSGGDFVRGDYVRRGFYPGFVWLTGLISLILMTFLNNDKTNNDKIHNSEKV